MKISKIRGFVAFVIIIVLTALACAFHTGTGTLSALGLSSVAALCPVGALETFLGAKSLSAHALACLGITVIIVLIFGKAFCSWACPTPYIQAFFKGGKSEGKDGNAGEESAQDSSIADDGEDAPRNVCAPLSCNTSQTCVSCTKLQPVGGERDGVQFDTRHWVLGGALISSLVFGFPVFCLICPVGLTFATLIGLWHLFQFNETTWALIIFPLIIVIELVLFKKWCFKFCPIGALLGLFSKGNRFFKPRVDEETCLRGKGVDCLVCVEACPELLDPHTSDIPECSKCGQCIDRCPVQAISMKPFAFSRRKGTSEID